MAYYKFICKYDTEKECFARRLFGNDRKDLDGEQTLNVNRGDTLFLHNVGGNVEYLYGPFIALTDIHKGLEEDAWEGRFSWQVKVGWNEDIRSLRKGDLFEKTAEPEVEINRYAQRLDENEGEWLVERLREGQHAISHVTGDQQLS